MTVVHSGIRRITLRHQGSSAKNSYSYSKSISSSRLVLHPSPNASHSQAFLLLLLILNVLVVIAFFIDFSEQQGMDIEIANSHPRNVIEWSGVVFINQNMTIPFNTVLTIKDDATIVFYVDRYENLNEPLVITVDRGDLTIGSGVVFQSLDKYVGTPPPTPIALNTDNWGFFFRYYLNQPLNTPNTLNFNSVKVLKSRRIHYGAVPTFRMEGPTPITILTNCLFEGGYIAFKHEEMNHLEYSVFGADGCVFKSMESVIENPRGGPSCFISFFDSLIENMEIAVNYKGGQSKGVEIYSSIVRNVIQGVYSSNSVLIINSVFENFRVGVHSPIVMVSNSTFDNSLATQSGIAILNTVVNKKVTFDVTDSRFVNIMGVVIASDKVVSMFNFQNNSINKCEGTPDFRFSLLHTSGTVYKLTFDNNQILDSTSNQFSIINFGSLNETVSFSNNTLKNNRAKCIFSIGDALSNNYSSSWKINHNIFDNVATTTSSSNEKVAEICFRGNLIGRDLLLNTSFNYWGSNVDKSKNLDPGVVYTLISEKLHPQQAFSFVPYFRTSNVYDESPSNIGTYIPPTPYPSLPPPPPPANSSNKEPPKTDHSIIISVVIGTCVTLFGIIAITVIAVTVSIFLFRRRKRSNYLAIN